MPRHFLQLLLAIALTCAPLRAEDFESALTLLDKKDYSGSRAILKKLVEAQPSNGLYWFNLGSASFNAKDYEAAATAFRKVIELKSELAPAARLCLVKCLRNLSRVEEAKRELAEARLLDDKNELAEALASEETKLSAMAPTEKPYWADLDVGLGYDSNVFLDGISNSETGKPVAETTLDAGFRSGEWGLSYQGYSKETLGYPSGRFLSQTLRARGGVGSEMFSLSVSPAVQHQIFGLTPYLMRAIVDTVAKLGFVGAQYQYGKNFAQASQYSFLDGNTHSVSLFAELETETLQLRFLYTLTVDAIQDLVNDTALLPLKGYPHGPGVKLLWDPVDGWHVSIYANCLFRRFETLAQPGNLRRSDGQFYGYARVSRDFSSSLSAFASLGALLNRSTLDETSNVSDRNYSQLVAVTGVSWKIAN